MIPHVKIIAHDSLIVFIEFQKKTEENKIVSAPPKAEKPSDGDKKEKGVSEACE